MTGIDEVLRKGKIHILINFIAFIWILYKLIGIIEITNETV